MNNNEVSNPKVEVSKGVQLNDKDYITCLLSSLKELSKNYVVSMTETSNETLYQEYLSTFEKISQLQRDTYELMFRNGWYKLEKAESNKINQKYNMLTQEYSDLNL